MSQEADLQFDRAEFEHPAAQTQCGECQRQLTGYYYDVNGQTVCEACRYAIESRANAGSGAGRFMRAAGAGVVAATLGALLYYAISALTGYEFGLIAIVVGFGVGTAVRWGSNGRGGWAYQTLAIALTYLAIVATYIPPIVAELRQVAAESAEAGSQGSPADASVATASAEPPAAPQPTPASVAQPASPESVAPVSTGMIAGLAFFVVAIAIVAPFLGGFENIMGLIIIGIGLYEAWKLNRRTPLVISGPHALGSPASVSSGV